MASRGKRYSEEQIIAILKEASAGGAAVGEVIRRHGVSPRSEPRELYRLAVEPQRPQREHRNLAAGIALNAQFGPKESEEKTIASLRNQVVGCHPLADQHQALAPSLDRERPLAVR